MTIGSTVELVNALKVATGGEVLELAPGEYTGISLRAPRSYSAPVVVRSVDATNKALLINTTVLKDFVNLTFDNLSFTSRGSSLTYYPLVRLYGGQNITIKNSLFTGEKAPPETVWWDYGLQADGTTNLQVFSNQFKQLSVGTMLTNQTNLVLADNDYEQMSTDAADFAAINGGQILRNLAEAFTPFPGAHADGFQLHCAGSYATSSNVIFEDNAIFSEPVNRAQGIFIQGDPARYDDPTRRHKGITLRNNLGGATMWNGLMVGQSDDVLFDSNKLITVLGSDNMKSWFRYKGAIGVSRDNIGIQYVDETPGITHTNDNLNKAGTMDDVAAARAEWVAKFRAPPAPPKRSLSDIIADLDALVTELKSI